MQEPKLTVIILNHNTKEILADCLKSLERVRDELGFNVIVSDNSSTDGSPKMVKTKFSWVKLVEGPNLSFSNGNNRARKHTKTEYVLFLNSDTVVYKETLKKCVEYLDNNKDVGALGCKLVLPDGTLDKDARRRFPTPAISLNRLFLKNGRKYWYEDIDSNTTHEVDSLEGAFIMTRREILEEIGWFDEGYVFDGEDLDMCFQIKKQGYKIVYYPEVSILHLKGASKGKIKVTSQKINNKTKLNRVMQGVNSMEYFYKKNMWGSYPLILNYIVLSGIKFLKLIRYIKFYLKIIFTK